MMKAPTEGSGTTVSCKCAGIPGVTPKKTLKTPGAEKAQTIVWFVAAHAYVRALRVPLGAERAIH